VDCDVTNTGARAGEEVVQLYLRDDYSSVVTFDEQLRGFTRVSLAPGETKRVQFELKPEHLMLYDREGKWSIEPGRFTVSVGASSEDLRLRTTFTVTRADGTAPTEAPVRESKSDPR
jgi:beta-glucosidase